MVTASTLSGAVLTRSVTRPGVTGAETSTWYAGRLATLASPGVAGLSVYGYDALGRQTSYKDPRHSQASITNFVAGKDQIASETDAAGNPSNYTYHPQGTRGAGEIRSITLADTTVTWRAYTLRGELMATWGSQTNPTWREYNTYGQLEILHTWKSAPSLNVDDMPSTIPVNSATTTWIYDPATGLLSGKRDADAQGADYRYDVARRLTERKWARGGSTRVTTTYGYANGFDQLGSVTYNDGTPSTSFTYDRLGRAYSAGNGVAGSVYTYDPSTLLPDTETVSYDLDGDTVSDFTRVLDRKRDSYLRDSGWHLKDGSTVENEVEYRYDTAGRFKEVEAPSGLFTYGYQTNSYSLLESVTGPDHTVTNTWETNRDVLDLKENKVGTATVSSYDYIVNAIGQRTDVEQAGSAFSSAREITWNYDALGQVTSADSSIPAHDRAYEYDAIGNRKKSADSLALPGSDNYVANSLNQYTTGTTATVVPVFDFDGNATAYPVPAHSSASSTLGWDGENRLVSAAVNSVTTTYLYDAYSRRIATKQGTTTTIRVYDGWNPVAEYSRSTSATPSTALTSSFAWGLDLSGSLQGAGGVGGLLAVTKHSSTTSSHYYPTYDGNGNVSEYLNDEGAVAAHYEYDPFGRTVVAAGAKAADFTHRFSTKPLDQETGLYYYAYRYYDPVTGRWPSRDPIGEVGSSAWIELQHRCELVKIALWDEYVSLGRPELGYHFAAAIRTVDSISKSPSETLSGPSRYAILSNNVPNDVDRLGLIGYGGGGGGFGEKWDALWDAGPFDASEAADIAKKTSKDARDTNLPGPHNGPQDAYRHCLWNCRMAKSIGQEDAKQIADNHEDHGNNPKDEEEMDKCNNREGRDCAKDPKRSCEDCCSDKLKDGTLQTLPQNRW